MTEREQALGSMLSKIADELNISHSMHEKAVRSYESVGKWIGEGVDYELKIMPQGSMNLGTVVRPINDSDEYDVDLVCLLKKGASLPLNQIKNKVGDRLKENETYHKKLEDEGKRCWTMQYDEFHMDILPCVPKDGLFSEPRFTAIKLTHKNESGIYEPRFSNPYAYHAWFEERMRDVLLLEKRAFALKNKTVIDNVPTYTVRTPLQKVIQLLKRHRDICFQNNNADSPISIIITTLAACSYNGETDVYNALLNILKRMPDYIDHRNGELWIENPVMKVENFADKWNKFPNKHKAFVSWLSIARQELINDPLACFGIDAISKNYRKHLGEAPVDRALKFAANEIREAREKDSLLIKGLTGGLTTSASPGSKSVKDHTFFGD